MNAAYKILELNGKKITISRFGKLVSGLKSLPQAKAPYNHFNSTLKRAKKQKCTHVILDLSAKKSDHNTKALIASAKDKKCKHSLCGDCGGYIKKDGLGHILTDLCSPQCIAATSSACGCKCKGKYHAGNNAKKLDKILKRKAKKPATKKHHLEPETPTDFLAEYLKGKRIKTSSWDHYSDLNYRKDNKALALNWLSKTGMEIDRLAHNFKAQEVPGSHRDESEIIADIVEFVLQHPGGAKSYVKSNTEPHHPNPTKPNRTKKHHPNPMMRYPKGYNIFQGLGKVETAVELGNKTYKTLNLGGIWGKWLGKPATNFDMMVDGEPGGGKSTLLLQFAEYLGKDLRLKVLFVSKEEMGSPTLVEKIKRLGIKHVSFCPLIFPDARIQESYDVCFIDSITALKFQPEDYVRLREENPDMAFVLVLQRTKDGKFRGGNDWPHEVEITAKVEDGKAYTTKNRYAHTGQKITIPNYNVRKKSA